MTVIVSPIVKNRHKEYREIHIIYSSISRMRRLAFEIESHFLRQTVVRYSVTNEINNNLVYKKLCVLMIGDFENYLYNLKFEQIAVDVLIIGDKKWKRIFSSLHEYLKVLPHFQKSFFDENEMIIKNFDELK